MPNATRNLIGQKLRTVRQQQRLSLHDVQDQTLERFKASALGSYERGDRVIPSDKLVELAAFYGVKPRKLLP